jgi:hypothetical protein
MELIRTHRPSVRPLPFKMVHNIGDATGLFEDWRHQLPQLTNRRGAARLECEQNAMIGLCIL